MKPKWSTFIPYPPTVTTTPDVPGINPKQLVFLLLDDLEVLYGGAAGGGKSEGLLLHATQNVDDHPVASLLLRRTFRDLDKPGGLMFRAREWFHGTRAHWDGINHRWIFPSGATINFGYLEHAGDELKYQSSEYQMIGFDELTQFDEAQYTYLFSRLRRLRGMTVPLRMRSATNPGGPGHEWVRKRFNLPFGPPSDSPRKFIFATLDDNPFLDAEEYEKSFDQLSGTVYKQLREGDWDAMAGGGFFDTSKFRVVGWGEVPLASDFAAFVRYWDFASTEPSDDNPDPDYTAGLKVGRTHHGSIDFHIPDYYIFDVERFRLNPGGVEARVKAAAEKDGRAITQYVEQERGSAGKTVVAHYNNNVLPSYTVRPLYATGDKETRARIAAARTQEGRVFLVEGPWIRDFTSEAAMFPIGAHDDQIDAFANGLICLEREMQFVDMTGRVQRHHGKDLKPAKRYHDDPALSARKGYP